MCDCAGSPAPSPHRRDCGCTCCPVWRRGMHVEEGGKDVCQERMGQRCGRDAQDPDSAWRGRAGWRPRAGGEGEGRGEGCVRGQGRGCGVQAAGVVAQGEWREKVCGTRTGPDVLAPSPPALAPTSRPSSTPSGPPRSPLCAPLSVPRRQVDPRPGRSRVSDS